MKPILHLFFHGWKQNLLSGILGCDRLIIYSSFIQMIMGWYLIRSETVAAVEKAAVESDCIPANVHTAFLI